MAETLDELYGRDIAFKDDFVLTPNGDLDTVAGIANLKEALFRRLITVKGTIIHRPDYGVGVQEYRNAPNSLPTKQKLANEIKVQFEQDSRVQEVLGVSMESEDLTPDKTIIKVRVKPIGYDETTMQFVPFGGE